MPMFYERLKCTKCGRFMSKLGSVVMRYSGHPPAPDHEEYRCIPCTEKHGPLSE